MKHLTTRLAVLLMLALMIITGGYDYVRLTRDRDRLIETSRTDQRILAETLAIAVRRNVRRGRTTDELEELLDDIGLRPGLIWVAIFDPKGKVIAAGVGSGAQAPAGDDLVAETLRDGTPSSSPPPADGAHVLRYVQPFRWPDGRFGAVEVRHSLGHVQRDFAAAVRERIAARLLILTCFVLAIVSVARWSIARPMRALIRAARAVGGGDLTQRIRLKRADELGALAEEFNRMAANLEDAHHALLAQSEERLRLEREAQQAQKLAAVGLLAAEVAHEVGTPLNVVAGRAEAMERSIPVGHPERRNLDAIQQQANRIAGIVRALLDYARPRQPDLRPEAVPAILSRVAGLLESRFRSKGTRVVADWPPDLPRVLADADQLQQVFINLLTNAIDASPPDAAVRVLCGPDPVLPADGRAEIVRGKASTPTLDIHVVDQGPGLTADEMAHVFEPFFSTKKRHQGTGLGLPIVEEIIRAHRGEIAMLSVAGHGTEAIVRLPVAVEEAAANILHADLAPAGTGPDAPGCEQPTAASDAPASVPMPS